jgi:MFS family permease
MVSNLSSLLMFMCLFTIPLYFQLVRGTTAAQSGLYLTPFMLASAAGNVAGARWAKRFGTLRGAIRLGSCLCCAGLILLALLPLNAPIWVIVLAMVLTGPGVGSCLISATMSAQNALSAKDMGSGTGALLVLRSVGGASGSTLAGAIIASGMIATNHSAAGMRSIAHSAQHTSAALAHVSASSIAPVNASLGSTFAMVYAAAAGVGFVIFIVSLIMPDSPLRETTYYAPVAD